MASGTAEVTLRKLFLRLLVCTTLWMCLLYYGYTHFYRDPGSIFFDAERAYERKYSRFRQAEVQRSIGNVGRLSTSKSGPNATICLAFSSVKRPHADYLETSVASILHGLSDRERADLHLSVTIAQTAPDQHPDWQSQWLRSVTDDFDTYNIASTTLQQLELMEATGDYSRKGVHDYSYVLRRCYEAQTPYIAILEDDILAADGWLIRTLLGLRTIAEQHATEPWLFLRLFTQDRSIGWATKDLGGNHEGYIIFAAAFVILGLSSLVRNKWSQTRRYLDWNTILVVAFVLNPSLVLLFFQSGKVSVLSSLSAGVVDQPYGCCSQALVFPREIVPAVIGFLQAEGSGQVDLLLNRFARERPLKRYALYPVQFQHMGIDSARKTSKEEAQQVWSIGFEDLPPAQLESDRARLLKELYDV